MQKGDKDIEDKRKVERRGLFVVVDGLDGIGKGEVERALVTYEQKLGKAVLDTVAFSKAHAKGIPQLEDFWNPPHVHYHTLSTAEPTYAGMGHQIRFEMGAAHNEGVYSCEALIKAFSLDRLIQMKRVVIPAIRNGLNVFQARCVAATFCYQLLNGIKEGFTEDEVKQMIMNEQGTKLQLKYAPDLLIIPTIKDIGQLEERLKERAKNAKDDKSYFEDIEFQRKLSPHYQSEWLRKIFEENGTMVKYLDAGVSEQSTRDQAVTIYKEFLAQHNGKKT